MTVERHIKRQFRLTSNDLKVLRPIIRRENEELLLILGRCRSEESTDYISLWNMVRTTRRIFENGWLSGLTQRQRQALRSARGEFESRIMGEWLDDYLQELSNTLELDRIQSNLVEKVFVQEHQKRLKLLSAEARNSSEIDVSWQKLTEEREKQLEKILDPLQLRAYHSMTGPVELLVGVVFSIDSRN